MNVDRGAVRIVDDPALSMHDVARFAAPRPEADGRHRFIAAGRLAPQKNFPLLLRAFARIARDNDRLIILGEGPERAMLEKLAMSLGIGDRFTLAGHVADLAPWFADADIFALSSDYEGVPAVIAEALAAGLAIAATNSSVSMNDMLADGRFGEIVAPNDLGALATALDKCRTIAVDVSGMRSQAERFTVEKAASHYAAIFAETVSTSPPLTPDAKRR